MKILSKALAIAALIPTLAFAEPVRVKGNLPVDEAIARVEQAVTAAGAKVFLVVDFAAGNASVGEDLAPTKLILFGSPKIGATAIQASQQMALFVPLRLLAYEDADGQTWLSYLDATKAAADYGLPTDHPAIARMQGALTRMATVAAGN